MKHKPRAHRLYQLNLINMPKKKSVEIVEKVVVEEIPRFPYVKQMNGFTINVIDERADGTLVADDGCTYKE
jgi:hypothetical protein